MHMQQWARIAARRDFPDMARAYIFLYLSGTSAMFIVGLHIVKCVQKRARPGRVCYPVAIRDGRKEMVPAGASASVTDVDQSERSVVRERVGCTTRAAQMVSYNTNGLQSNGIARIFTVAKDRHGDGWPRAADLAVIH